MGCDARAKVIYGFPIYGEGTTAHCPKDVEENWKRAYAAKKGSSDPDSWEEQSNHAKNAPVAVHYEGDLSSDVTTAYLTHKAAVISCDWDGPTEITPEMITPKPQWDVDLLEFCELMEIPWQKPKTMIICSMG